MANLDTPMIMGTTTATPTESAALLGMMWLASPALPVGAFSYSEGLEAVVDRGQLQGEAQVQAWLLDHLALALARSDMALVAGAWTAYAERRDADIPALNDWVLHTRETAELRQQSLQTGRSLAQWLLQRHPDSPRAAALVALGPGPTWPVAFAAAAQHLHLPLQATLLALGFGWAENMVQAAVKCVPLGQSAGQRVLGALVQALPAQVAAATERAARGDWQAFAPGLALASAQHEQQYSRLFRS